MLAVNVKYTSRNWKQKVDIDYNDININIDNSYGQIQIDINIGHLLIETCFWNVVNVYA